MQINVYESDQINFTHNFFLKHFKYFLSVWDDYYFGQYTYENKDELYIKQR